MKIIHKDCDKSLAKDRSLPRNSYIITYIQNDITKYDIVQASGFVEVFDNYYDNLGKDSVQKIQWTDGTVNPRLWGTNTSKKKK